MRHDGAARRAGTTMTRSRAGRPPTARDRLRRNAPQTTARHMSFVARLVAALIMCVSVAAHADERIGVGGISSVNNGTVNLGCTDLIVTGTLNVNQGTYFNVRNVSVLAGGRLNGGTGSLTLSGTFTVVPGGLYNQQQLVVRRDSVCAALLAPEARPIPTLHSPLLFMLAALMLWVANRVFRSKRLQRRQGQ